MIELPIREDLKGKSPYGAPQLNTPVRLNTNENPYPPSDDLAREIGEEAARLAVTLNRYPDRDAVQLRTDLAAYASRATGVPVTHDNVWAANGSNEVMHQLLEHRWYLAERAGHDVPIGDALAAIASDTPRGLLPVQLG